MREEDDRGMRIKTGAVKTPTPFGIIGESIKSLLSRRQKTEFKFKKTLAIEKIIKIIIKVTHFGKMRNNIK